MKKILITVLLGGVLTLSGRINNAIAQATSGFRFTVTLNNGSTLNSGFYESEPACNSAKSDYASFTPRSDYKSISSCTWQQL